MISIVAAMVILLAIPKQVQEPEEVFEADEMIISGSEYYIQMDEEDIDLMARVVMSEAGNQPGETKEAVATVILNRLNSPNYPCTIKDVVYAKNQFSTADNGKPTDDCYAAVYSALVWYGTDNQVIPWCVYYFRSGHYHTWAQNYCKLGDLYFSAPKDACLE